jgi:hypothetical protein
MLSGINPILLEEFGIRFICLINCGLCNFDELSFKREEEKHDVHKISM